MAEIDLPHTGWNAAKVEIVKKSFYEFLPEVIITSKETGAHTRLIEHIYRAQIAFYDGVFAALAEDKHNIFVLKARQLGLSTSIRPLFVFWAGIHDGLRGAMVYDTAFNTGQARREVTEVIQTLPRKLHFPPIIEDNRDGLRLENGSQILFMQAGVRNNRSGGGLGRSVGLNFAHCSEMSSWVNEEGVKSFRQSLSDIYPDRLYVWESTARGFELFYRLWKEARLDDLGSAAMFFGWWSKDSQCLAKGTADFARYGLEQPTAYELRRMQAVWDQYGWEVTQEQLAWYRKKIDPNQELDDDSPEDSTLIQEQPWCVTADTRVGTDQGIVRIADVRSNNGTSGTLGAVMASGPTGEAPIWRAETHLGYVIEGTFNHPLMLAEGGQVDLSKAMGEHVKLCPPRFRDDGWPLHVVRWRDGITQSCIEITPEFARLAGIYMGDGSLQGGDRSSDTQCTLQIVFDTKDRDFVDDTKRLIVELFGVTAIETTHDPKGTGGWVAVRANSKMIVSTFKKLGLSRNDTGKTMRNVHVPEWIWKSPKHVIKEFLSGIFETDGFNDYSSNRCVLFTKYERFSRDVQLLLLAFGITSRRRTALKRSGDGAHEYIGYEIQLRSSEAIKFNDEVGFLSKRKRARAIKPKKPDAGNRGRSCRQIMFRDEIVSIQETGRIEEVFNLTIGDHHLFDCNGILTHNTEEEAFQQTGASFFQSDKLSECSAALATMPRPQCFRFVPGIDFIGCEVYPARTRREIELRVWEEPCADSVYIIAGDPAFGHNEKNNNSAAQVLRCFADGIDQVCEYASALIDPHQFAWLLWTLVGYYGMKPGARTMTICELNGPGEEVWRQYNSIPLLIQQGYLRARARDKGLGDIFINTRNYIFARSDSMNQIGHNYQWVTSNQRKIAIMESERNYLNNGVLRVRSLEVLEEMRTITRDGDTIGAEGKDRDDLTFAMALGIRAWDEKLRRGLISGNRTREAERARLSVTMQDQQALWNKNTLDMFFKRNETVRMNAARALRSGFRATPRRAVPTRRF